MTSSSLWCISDFYNCSCISTNTWFSLRKFPPTIYATKPSVVTMLLELGANVHAINKYGNNALFTAVFAPKNSKIIKLLLNHGINFMAINKANKSVSCDTDGGIEHRYNENKETISNFIKEKTKAFKMLASGNTFKCLEHHLNAL